MNRFLLAMFLAPVVTAAQTATTSRAGRSDTPPNVVAQVGDRVITHEALEERAADRLARVRADEYAIKKQVLDEFVLQLLLEQEARARGLSVLELQRQEIDAKVAPVTEDAKRAIFESNPQQFQGRSEQEALAQIEVNLKRGRESEARRRLSVALRAKAGVRVFMNPPRVEVDSADQPSRGSQEAPVTMVVFSDYQCPYCARLEPTLKQVLAKYDGQVRLVFRDFPLTQIHPNATKSAEAAACAREQGKFWDMHERMFTNQKALGVPDLKRAAALIGLETAKFDECLDSGRMAAKWQKDLRDGQRYGVGGTPSVFVNGRLIRGASTVPGLSEVIDEELALRTPRN